MSEVRLRTYDNSWYSPGGTSLARSLWFFLGLPVLRSQWIPSSGLRVWLLRAFGAQIGSGVVIKTGVRVKYPWHLRVGNDTWLGENCWIDNLVMVRIGNDCCVSQGAYLCTGNHDWSDPGFGLMVAPITMEDGAWAGAKSILAPGVVLEEGAVAAAGSVIAGRVPRYEIYAGNPGVFIKRRRFKNMAGDAAAHGAEDRLRV